MTSAVQLAHSALLWEPDPADIAMRRIADEFIAEQREIRKRKPQWTGQDNFNRDQGSNYSITGWGR